MKTTLVKKNARNKDGLNSIIGLFLLVAFFSLLPEKTYAQWRLATTFNNENREEHWVSENIVINEDGEFVFKLKRTFPNSRDNDYTRKENYVISTYVISSDLKFCRNVSEVWYDINGNVSRSSYGKWPVSLPERKYTSGSEAAFCVMLDLARAYKSSTQKQTSQTNHYGSSQKKKDVDARQKEVDEALKAVEEAAAKVEEAAAKVGKAAAKVGETAKTLDAAAKTTDSDISQTFTVNGVSFKMIHVGAGTFMMGATSEQGNAESDEKPAHRVTLSDYYIGETEVTQALWRAVMGSNPSYFKGDNLPVEQVSWDDCQTFIRKLNAATGKNFRLPTEAEWEFAARGGNKSRHTKYEGGSDLSSVAWSSDNSGRKTHPVAKKAPNDLGLYDTSGNVWEWCHDWYDKNYYSRSPSTNPCNNTKASYRVARGGSWSNYVGNCRVTFRGSSLPVIRNISLGLRLALK